MNIDDRLGELLHEFKFRTPEGAMPKGYDNTKQALYKDMLELIGEDDDVQWDTESWFCNNCDWQPVDGSKTCLCKIRNRLRQELRTKLRKYYGVEE